MQRINVRHIFMSAVLVFFFLFSVIGHTEHFDLTLEHAEKNCHLCQQALGNVDNDIQIKLQVFSCYSAYLPNIYQLTYHLNNAITPPLRAPPFNL
jgi:hypothetical protein